MKEPMDILKVYNLVDTNGNWLQLKLGRIKDYAVTRANPDKGFRWSFDGTKIPMPVRVRTWFNGFPEETMLDWLKANGWYPRTCVIPYSGYAAIYDLPDNFDEAEPEKANEEYVLNDYEVELGETALEYAVRHLYQIGKGYYAIDLYRYVHPCSVGAASEAVASINS